MKNNQPPKSKALAWRDRDAFRIRVKKMMGMERQASQFPVSHRKVEALLWEPEMWDDHLKHILDVAPDIIDTKRWIEIPTGGGKCRLTRYGYNGFVSPSEHPTFVNQSDTETLGKIAAWVLRDTKLAQRQHYAEVVADHMATNCNTTGQLLKCWPELVQICEKDTTLNPKLKGFNTTRAMYPTWFTAEHRAALLQISPWLTAGIILEDMLPDAENGAVSAMVTPDYSSINLGPFE